MSEIASSTEKAGGKRVFSAMEPTFYSPEARHANRAVFKEEAKANANDEIVTLNVGGKIFMTTTATLLKGRYNYFHALLALPPMVDGTYFLDWKPETFEHVLEYLRTNKLPSGITSEDRQQFHTLVRYLGIKGSSLRWKWSGLANNFELSNHDQTIKFIPNIFPSCGITVQSFQITVQSTGENLFSDQECHIRLDEYSEELYIGGSHQQLVVYDARGSRNEQVKNALGWYLEVASGQVFENGRLVAECSPKIKMGDVITLKQGYLAFTTIQVNGLDTGIEFPFILENSVVRVWSSNWAVLTILNNVDHKITWTEML